VLLTLAPDGATELSAQIDEKNLSLLAVGQPAQVSADAYAGRRFAAEVAYIAPSVDAQRGSVEIRLHVPEAPAYLKHEMTVSIDVETGQRADALVVPADCLRDADGAPWLLVVRDGVAERRPVRVGLRGAGRVEIVEGLSDGEAVLPAASPVVAGRRVSAVFR
jgi:HlyD family secretion protein